MAVSVLILLVATAAYVPYHLWSLNGPSGGSLMGLIYGFAGYGLMLFAGALGARTRRPTWRLGRAETWLKAHIWLALLAYPLILFHAGMTFGGPLTFVLMVVFSIVSASGIAGVVLQNILPRTMTDRVPLETIYEQIDHVLDQMRAEADALVAAACDPEKAAASAPKVTPGQRLSPADRQALFAAAAAARRTQGAGATPLGVPGPGAQSLQEFYDREVRPYLHDQDGRAAAMTSPAKAAVIFAQLRTRVPAALHPVVDDLEYICDERRQLRLQSRLHYWLHGWLLVHVPLSVGLLLLTAVHAVVALRY
ncbi:MAG: hypothetical protein ACRELA_00540 [Candidatus Rokuibacteriota bacterium]